MVSYGGKSYLGDLSAPNQILKYTASGRTDEKELIIPLTNSDGTQNSVEREVTGQGYNIIAGENKLYTGNLLKNCEVWDTDIASEISNVLAGNMVQKSKDLWLFRGNGGLKTATTPVFIHAKRHSVFDLEVECVYQSIQGTPYRAYFVCF